jgi:hypothetical protein
MFQSFTLNTLSLSSNDCFSPSKLNDKEERRRIFQSGDLLENTFSFAYYDSNGNYEELEFSTKDLMKAIFDFDSHYFVKYYYIEQFRYYLVLYLIRVDKMINPEKHLEEYDTYSDDLKVYLGIYINKRVLKFLRKIHVACMDFYLQYAKQEIIDLIDTDNQLEILIKKN